MPVTDAVPSLARASWRRHAVWQGQADPLAGLAAALILGLALVVTLDVLSASVALALEAVCLPFVRVSRTVWLRCGFLAVAAVLAAVTTGLYGETSGAVYVHWGLLTVSAGSLELAAAIALRILAVGIPAIVLLADVDVTVLADSLAQIARLPARFVLGALAGMRLAALFAADWRMLSLTRRARGVAGGGPVRRLRGAAWQVFALLVLAIRRGSVLAVAMDVRGFARARTRTWARPAVLGVRDFVTVAAAAAIAGCALGAAVLSGSFNFVLA